MTGAETQASAAGGFLVFRSLDDEFVDLPAFERRIRSEAAQVDAAPSPATSSTPTR